MTKLTIRDLTLYVEHKDNTRYLVIESYCNTVKLELDKLTFHESVCRFDGKLADIGDRISHLKLTIEVDDKFEYTVILPYRLKSYTIEIIEFLKEQGVML